MTYTIQAMTQIAIPLVAKGMNYQWIRAEILQICELEINARTLQAIDTAILQAEDAIKS